MWTQVAFLVLFAIAAVSGQTYRTCIQDTRQCSTITLGDSQVVCASNVASKVDCALKITRGEADFGVFSEEELMLLSHVQGDQNRVVATIRDEQKTDEASFEAVAVVPSTFTGGLKGLSGARYCHPGFDKSDAKWSPRVLRALENAAADSNRCPDTNTDGKTAEEIEVDILSKFFSAACRPGQWSANDTIDANLKRQYPNLCSLCGPNSDCSGYKIDMGVQISGANNNNRHIQALECLRTNSVNQTAVAYVAWQHVREFFLNRATTQVGSFAILCPDGSLRQLTNDLIVSTTSPCAFVRQPWRAIVANSNTAPGVLAGLRNWWPNGSRPSANWQMSLFDATIQSTSARVFWEEGMPTTFNYTNNLRTIPAVDATSNCIPSRRWCVVSTEELNKCNWVRNAAHTLGIQPSITCVLRANHLQCLQDIKNSQADFMAVQANYGYLARQHYGLSAVKLVQNQPGIAGSTARVAAFIKNSAMNEISRFENLRGKRACFPEYGGLAYVAFLRTAQVRGVIKQSECDYARAVGEFFQSACAPGAIDASHALSSQSTYNAANLCSVCKPQPWYNIAVNETEAFCAWDYRNLYFGNNGTLACLSDPSNDVAILQIGNIDSFVTPAEASQYRALCANNTLALNPGVNIPDSCLLAHVVDSEVVSRRNDPHNNAVSVLLDNLDQYFGSLAATKAQLINLEIYENFDGVSHLLFKNSVIGLTEPSANAETAVSKNYFELFAHLDSCTSAANPGPTTVAPGMASRQYYSVVTVVVMSLLAKFVVY